jgi:hypothetical protein
MEKILCGITVKNMIGHNDKPVKNQFIINTPQGRAFQSYDSIIAFVKGGKVYLDEKYWDFSTTTGKYRNIFLKETKKETIAKIKSGEYTLTDLNSKRY